MVDAFTAFAHSSLGSGQLHHGAEWKTKAAILGWCVEWLQVGKETMATDAPYVRRVVSEIYKHKEVERRAMVRN